MEVCMGNYNIIGMKNMKSRVEKINGKLLIETEINKGTKVEVQITLK